MRTLVACLIVSPLVVWAAPVSAQPMRTDTTSTQSASAPPSASTGPGVEGYVALDVTRLAAQRSFKAVLGTSNLRALGAGADVTRLWNGLFVRVAITSRSADGNRAFAFQNSDGSFAVFSLGIPLTMTMRPIELAGGWRFESTRRSGRVTPYAGGGLLLVHYTETSQFAEPGENVSQTFKGVAIFGGVDVVLAKMFLAGVEVQYRRVPNALGVGGVAGAFGDTDLGGLTIRARIGIAVR